MKHPVWSALGVSAAVVAVASLYLSHLHQPASEATTVATVRRTTPAEGLPWQVDVLPDGSSRVMGLHLGSDTLAQVRERTGDNLQLALVARLGEVGALEALADPFNAGFISGRLVLSFDVAPAVLLRWREGSTGSSPMEGGARRFALRAQDLPEAEQARLAALSFIPTARLTRV